MAVLGYDYPFVEVFIFTSVLTVDGFPFGNSPHVDVSIQGLRESPERLAEYAEADAAEEKLNLAMSRLSQSDRVRFLVALNGAGPGVETQTDSDDLVLSPEGCRVEAEELVYGARAEYYQVQSSLETAMRESFDQAYTSKVVTMSLEIWAGCMADRGYETLDPSELRSLIDSTEVSDSEITVALADQSCKEVSRLYEAWTSEYATAQRNLYDSKYTETIAEWIKLKDELVRRSTELES